MPHFKSDKQRKCVMAKLNANQIRRIQGMTFPQLIKKGVMLPPKGDIDKDGVINIKDCKPFDPKKQGKLHELKIRFLKRREEKLEIKREKELRKLEDLKDELKIKTSIATKDFKIKDAKRKSTQAVIDEINKEKNQLATIKKANKDAKEELRKLSFTGKANTAITKGAVKTVEKSKDAIAATQSFLRKKSTKKVLKGISNFFSE